MTIPSIVCPLGAGASTCGYCGPPGQRSETPSSHVTRLQPVQLSCEAYQQMIDRGWRRSGTYCYKPNLKRSCCPQYTIKLDVLEFKPSHSQRKLMNRWTRFVLYGKDENAMDSDHPRPGKGKHPKLPPFELISSVHASEVSFIKDQTPAHRFEVNLELSSFTHEKYMLFEKYQAEIHKDDSSESGFKRFLCDTPLHRELIKYTKACPSHLPTHYGSYHQMYRVDGELIAVGVIDVLPTCVSSVYFMYNKDWEQFSLGKLSAMREASLAREIHEAGAAGMGALYMGFYIHSCTKMRYKGEYSPSYLADPETYQWYPLKQCQEQLDHHRYACFANPDHSIAGPGPVQDDPMESIPQTTLSKIYMMAGVENNVLRVEQIDNSTEWRIPALRRILMQGIYGLGLDLAQDVVFTLRN